MDNLNKIVNMIGIVIYALFLISPFILTPISFIYNWLLLLKFVFIIEDIIFFVTLCAVLFELMEE